MALNFTLQMITLYLNLYNSNPSFDTPVKTHQPWMEAGAFEFDKGRKQSLVMKELSMATLSVVLSRCCHTKAICGDPTVPDNHLLLHLGST